MDWSPSCEEFPNDRACRLPSLEWPRGLEGPIRVYVNEGAIDGGPGWIWCVAVDPYGGVLHPPDVRKSKVYKTRASAKQAAERWLRKVGRIR